MLSQIKFEHSTLKKNCLEIYYSKCDKADVEDSADSNRVVFCRKFQSVIFTFRLENESQKMLVLDMKLMEFSNTHNKLGTSPCTLAYAAEDELLNQFLWQYLFFQNTILPYNQAQAHYVTEASLELRFS